MHIARLKPVPLREMWAHEARDFTTWLAENLDLLGETLGIPRLSLVQREAAAGIFAADILADDGQDRLVVIENQLESTDHDHLGKLITYLSNLEAKIAVWITSAPRPEHERAVHWLNELLPADMAFYLVQIEAFRIGDSPPAPKFTVVAGPSREAQQAGEQKKELAERHLLRLEFWKQLLERARAKTPLHAHIAPGTENWISASAGKSGLGFNYVVRMEDARVELYIDRTDAEQNKQIFDALYERKAEIEQAFGGPLEWQRLDAKRACRILHLLPGGGLLDQHRWPEIQDRMIDAMIRLERAFKPEIQRLKVG
ncbi:MAG: DUF4268 domain-containing protein [Anaerolineae bacterium]